MQSVRSSSSLDLLPRAVPSRDLVCPNPGPRRVGIPPLSQELRTVYVEHDIDASEAETPVVEYVFSDPLLQDASHPAHSRVEEVRSPQALC